MRKPELAEMQEEMRERRTLELVTKFTAPGDEQRDFARRIKRYLVSHMGGKCHDCSGQFHYAVYHFDHRDPSSKSFNISANYSRSLDKLMLELEKCDMVCANCHAMRTFGSEAIRQKIKQAKNAPTE